MTVFSLLDSSVELLSLGRKSKWLSAGQPANRWLIGKLYSCQWSHRVILSHKCHITAYCVTPPRSVLCCFAAHCTTPQCFVSCHSVLDHITLCLNIVFRTKRCDCCHGPLVGDGLTLIRPGSLFGVKNVPFLFKSCSHYCARFFMKNNENLLDLIYDDEDDFKEE